MNKKSVYKITINQKNWEKYNSKLKPGHPSVMISKRFFDDAKVQSLPAGGKLLYLGLLLARGDVRESSFEASHQQLVSFAGGSGQHVHSLLRRLQSLQLLSYEILTLIEENRREENRKEEKRSSTGLKSGPSKNQKPDLDHDPFSPPPAPLVGGKSGRVWENYSSGYFKRYNTTPVRNKKTNAQLCQLVDRLGETEAPLVAAFYLTHNDALYVRSRHAVDFLLRDAEKLRTEWVTGKKATKFEAQHGEEKDFYANQQEEITKMFREGTYDQK